MITYLVAVLPPERFAFLQFRTPRQNRVTEVDLLYEDLLGGFTCAAIFPVGSKMEALSRQVLDTM